MLLAAMSALLLVAGIACSSTKEVIKEVPGETVIKEVPGETVIKEVVVTPTPASDAGTSSGSEGPKFWTIGFPEDVTTTNVWDMLGPGSTAYNYYAFLNQYPALMSLSDKRFDYVPALADGFPTDAVQEGDFWTITAKLRDGAKWSDGEAIDADDFVFTVDTALDFGLPGNWATNIDPEIVDHLEAVDPLTVKFYFKSQPGLSRWQFGLAQQAIVAEHFWAPLVAEAGAAGTDEEQRQALYAITPENEPKGGEMVFAKWEPGAFVELEKNPNYYWQDSTVDQYASGAYSETAGGETFTAYGDTSGDVDLSLTRSVAADTTSFSIFSSQDAAILALRAEEIDYFLSPLGLSAGLKNQVQGQSGITTVQNPSNGFRYLGFNLRREPMADPAFRTAVATLIDKEFLTEKILQNAAFPIYTVVPEGNGFWWNKDVPQIGKGLDREGRINEVVKILGDAGYTWETEPAWNADGRKVDAGKGLKNPDGEAVTELEILAPSAGYDPLRATSAIWIEQWLNEAGIPVTANLTGFNVIVPRLWEDPDFGFDMWILGWGLTVYPDYLADFFHTNQSELGGLNVGGYSNDEFDALADAFIAETDTAEARVQAFELQEFLASDLPYVTLFATPIYEAYRSDTVEFAFTDVLDGVQNYFQSFNGPLAHSTIK
ncbi:MAG: ABC transporter substrate-binding protein [Dehalococcoidia bacterium]|nr:ABC transporter substrate-binding protein [Dehalococcoidia bacterium]